MYTSFIATRKLASQLQHVVANPTDSDLLDRKIMQFVTNHPEGSLVMDYKDLDIPESELSNDRFRKLPVEIRDMILSHLSSRDIAQLQFISRSYRQLTKSLFRSLIQKEKPWFWELERLEQVVHDRSNLNWKRQDINWMTVWTGLQRLQSDVLGIRNRVRIWTLAEEVVARIGRSRDSLEGEELLLEPSEFARQHLAALGVRRCLACKVGLGYEWEST
jgi:hypothetical protein